MLRFLAYRSLGMFVTLFVVSIMVFAIMQLPPGNYAERYAFRKFSGSSTTITAKDIENIKIQLGLNKPAWKLYIDWIWGITSRFDFGPSFAYETSVNNIIKNDIGYTLLLLFGSLILVYLVAVPLGVLAAVYKHSIWDYSLTILGYMGFALPPFLLALILMYFLNIHFDLSVGGFLSSKFQNAPWSFAKIWNLIEHLFVPIVVLTWSNIAFQAQTIRATMSDEINKPYVTAAIARGVPRKEMLFKYPLRVAINPLLSTIGFDVNRIFSDLPIVALVLNLPELGQLLIKSYMSLDMYTAGAILLLVTFIIVFMNFISDILLAIIDPRVRIYGGNSR